MKNTSTQGSKNDAKNSSDVNDNDDDDEGYFADVGFMFEKYQPTHLQEFEWSIDDYDEMLYTPASHNDDDVNTSTTTNTIIKTNKRTKLIKVAIHCANDSPGAVQSGHYLWPGAQYLVEYLLSKPDSVQQQQQIQEASNFQIGDEKKEIEYNLYQSPLPPSPYNNNDNVVGIIELGAGCSLVALFALQYYQRTVQCVLVTDHDPGTLVRASDNYEITLQHIINTSCTTTTNNNNKDTTAAKIHTNTKNEPPRRQHSGYDTDDAVFDEQLNSVINTIPSVPIFFEQLKWGCQNYDTNIDKDCSSNNSNNNNNNNKAYTERLWYKMSEHISEPKKLTTLSPTTTPAMTVENTNEYSDSRCNSSATVNTVASTSTGSTYLILGSDLIYCSEVVMPLFETVATFFQLILEKKQQQQHSHPSSSTSDNDNTTIIHIRFILSQSFVYDEETEEIINNACTKFNLHRTILVHNDNNTDDIDQQQPHATGSNHQSSTFCRIQEFVPNHHMIK